MFFDGKIWVGTGDKPANLLPKMANRHGLIAGATGTGKTVTLKVLAEGFAQMGVPVFLSDVKGDLAGMVKAGVPSESLQRRLDKVGVKGEFEYKAFTSVFWDVYGEKGHPVRATVAEMGPLLLSRMLSLNETQTGVLNILFRVAEDENLPLITILDVKAMLAHVGENARDYQLHYGNVSSASVGAIQRALAVLEDQGGDIFFGEPALDIFDWMRTDDKGVGVINILAAEKLFGMPTMYATFLLWMLTELYQLLPEEGDLDIPKMVFFFDEAHLLFNDCPKALMDKIEQVIRLIRSKAVGVYFITQNPADVPMTVLSQLGNRVQHALRAYTPLDQRGVKAAADTFRANPAFDTSEAITQLKTGEALVSFLDEGGAPTVVERAMILPPQSFMGAIEDAEREKCIEASALYGKYDIATARQGAYAKLNPEKTAPAIPVFNGFPMMTGIPIMQMPSIPMQASPLPIQPQSSPTLFNATTGQYMQKEMETMTNIPNNDNNQAPVFVPSETTPNVPVMQMPVQPVPQQVVQPVMQPMAQPAMQPMVQPGVSQPVAPQPMVAQPSAPQLVQMPTLVQDPATGQYVQQMVTMQYNPATGQYIPYTAPQQPAELTKEQLNAQKAQIAAQKEADRVAKEQEAARRRDEADELRQERAERARFNDSVLGRVKNSAISSATRTVTNTITRTLLNALTGKKSK